MRLATGRPSGVSWLGEREVVKPMAPARSASRSSRSIARRSSSVAGPLERALAHHVGAQRGVADVARVVDALGQRLEARRGTRGRSSSVHSMPASIASAGMSSARCEVAHDEVLVLLGAGREREAAVAHDHAGDAVPARATCRAGPRRSARPCGCGRRRSRARRPGPRRRSPRARARGCGRWRRCGRARTPTSAR